MAARARRSKRSTRERTLSRNAHPQSDLQDPFYSASAHDRGSHNPRATVMHYIFAPPTTTGGRNNPCDNFDCAEAFGHGAFQMGVFLYSATCAWIMQCHTLLLPLITTDVDHWCKQPADQLQMSATEWKRRAIPVDAAGRHVHCVVYARPGDPSNTSVVSCEDWDYDPQRAAATAVRDLNLVCSRVWMLAVANGSIMLVSAFIVHMSLTAKWYQSGRKSVVWWAATGLTISAPVGYLIGDTYFWSPRGIVVGLSSLLSNTVCVVLAEVSTRANGPVLVSLSFIVGLVLGDVCFAILSQHRLLGLPWRSLEVAMTVPTLLALPMGLLLMQESPRWLVAQGKLADAETAMRAAARINNLPQSQGPDTVIERIGDELLELQIPEHAARHAQTPHTDDRRRGVVLFNASFTAAAAYFSLELAWAARGPVWLHVGSVGADCIAHLAYLVALERTPRPRLLVFIYLIVGASCSLLSLALLGGSPEAVTDALRIPAKAAASVAVVATSLLATETFPTPVRVQGVLLAHICGRMGGAVASATAMLRPMGHEDTLLAVVATVVIGMAWCFKQFLPGVEAPPQKGQTPGVAVVADEGSPQSTGRVPKGQTDPSCADKQEAHTSGTQSQQSQHSTKRAARKVRSESRAKTQAETESRSVGQRSRQTQDSEGRKSKTNVRGEKRKSQTTAESHGEVTLQSTKSPATRTSSTK